MFKRIAFKSKLLFGLIKTPNLYNSIELIFQHGPQISENVIFKPELLKHLISHKKYDKHKQTVLYVHGYKEDPEVISTRIIVNAYLKNFDTNLIVLDWSKLVNNDSDAIFNTKLLGPGLARILLEMFDNGLDIENFHIVGHMLGGQLAGLVGRAVTALSCGQRKLKRITALDPPFPLFWSPLNSSDAEFVDVIHHDIGWRRGTPFSVGTVDFWPHMGRSLQSRYLEHDYEIFQSSYAYCFWAESVADKYPAKFNVAKAYNWIAFKNGEVNIDDRIVMGHYCPMDVSGNYYLQTNDSPPYARGQWGTTYLDNDTPMVKHKEHI